MAAVHSGIIPQSCTKCQNDPSLKDVWGCNKPMQSVVERLIDYEGEVLEYYSCPMLFISKSSQDFYNEYALTKEGHVQALPYKKQSAKYVHQISYYQTWMDTYKSKIQEAKRL